MPRARLVSALLASLLLVWAGAALAHTSGAPAAAPVAPASTAAIGAAAAAVADATLWPWLAPLILLPALARRRGPKLLATTLVLFIVFFAAESAVHSVHHGFAGERTAVCHVAWAAAHVTGTDVETVAVAAPAPAVGLALNEPGPPPAKLRPVGPHQGRAPPSALA